MKPLLKYILAFYLKILAKIVLTINRPTIIAIAGSTNKTFTKDAIINILKNRGESVIANPKSYNTEIGLPLSILGLPSGYNSPRKWLSTLYQSFFCFFKKSAKFMVLELGISDQGDMKYLLSLIKPNIAVITDITQRYLESFSGMDELVDEYAYLIDKMAKGSLIVLNNDNARIKLLAPRASAKIATFGTEQNSNYFSSDIARDSQGQLFKVTNNDKVSEYSIPYYGRHHIYSFLAALIINDYVDKTEKI
jgi:UDP-N-acetylmuramoyl-tripeptide--D-alanyl-D-alanine ligase